jgi:uncharacterized protein HemY
MTDHADLFDAILTRLLERRDEAGGVLSQAEESGYAAELEACWEAMTDEQRELVAAKWSVPNLLSSDTAWQDEIPTEVEPK